MIFSNLSTILGKKKLKIADIIKNTKITRPTLTALYWNTGKGINFDTLDSLCNYLKITPGELLSFYDVDIEDMLITYDELTEDYFTVDDEYNSVPYISDAYFTGYIKFRQKNLGQIEISGDLSCRNLNKTFNASIKFHCSRDFYFNLGPDEVLEYIDDQIYDALLDRFPEDIDSIDSIDYHFDDDK